MPVTESSPTQLTFAGAQRSVLPGHLPNAPGGRAGRGPHTGMGFQADINQ